jgi:hypothetical protein
MTLVRCKPDNAQTLVIQLWTDRFKPSEWDLLSQLQPWSLLSQQGFMQPQPITYWSCYLDGTCWVSCNRGRRWLSKNSCNHNLSCSCKEGTMWVQVYTSLTQVTVWTLSGDWLSDRCLTWCVTRVVCDQWMDVLWGCFSYLYTCIDM